MREREARVTTVEAAVCKNEKNRQAKREAEQRARDSGERQSLLLYNTGGKPAAEDANATEQQPIK